MKKPLNTIIIFFLFPVFCLLPADVGSIEVKSSHLIVGTKESPPFSMKTADGQWEGISISLWRKIAAELDLDYEFREMSIPEMIEGLSAKKLDAAVAAMTVTFEREEQVDFSHPFYTAGLGIATSVGKRNPWFHTIRRFVSLNFLKVVLSLMLLLFVVGAMVWWFERKRNPEQFGGKILGGLGAGFWWSAVTMTTVGYGDKSPVSTGGRIIALIWMFTAIIIISSFTAAITSSLTVSQLEPLVKGPEDLPKVRVGSIAKTTSGQYLKDRQIFFRPFETPSEGLAALKNGTIDAFVYDKPILRYLITREYHGVLKVLEKSFLNQDYAIALPAGSNLREPLNRYLLKATGDPQWYRTLQQYLGQ